MKRAILFVILLILVSFGFFLGSDRSGRDTGQNAVILFYEDTETEGEYYEQMESYCLDLGVELPADSLCSQPGGADGEGG